MQQEQKTTDAKTYETTASMLISEIEKLLPFPGAPNYKGPIFIELDSAEMDQYAGVINQAETMASNDNLGMNFSQAAKGINLSDLLDKAEELIKAHTAQTAKSYELGRHNVISFDFAAASHSAEQLQAFKAELPKRLGLERMLAQILRKIHAMNIKPNFKMPALSAIPA